MRPDDFARDPGPVLQGILRDLAGYLRSLQEDGLSTVERAPGAVSGAPRPAPAHPAAGPVPSRPGAAPAAAPQEDLVRIAAEVAACTRCILHKSRTRTVPGQGALHPDILFVGEGPGAEEDRQGLAFVGAAGQLLTKMIAAMGATRDEVFIANVVKCRPPGNRTPLPDEMNACLPYLKRQIAVLQPKVIVALGAVAAHGLLPQTDGISRLRGHWFRFENIDLMPTFHPAYLLRNPPAKKEAWDDLKAVLKKLGRTPPPVPRTTPS